LGEFRQIPAENDAKIAFIGSGFSVKVLFNYRDARNRRGELGLIVDV
jgi:hypothetical protein